MVFDRNSVDGRLRRSFPGHHTESREVNDVAAAVFVGDDRHDIRQHRGAAASVAGNVDQKVLAPSSSA